MKCTIKGCKKEITSEDLDRITLTKQQKRTYYAGFVMGLFLGMVVTLSIFVI